MQTTPAHLLSVLNCPIAVQSSKDETLLETLDLNYSIQIVHYKVCREVYLSEGRVIHQEGMEVSVATLRPMETTCLVFQEHRDLLKS